MFIKKLVEASDIKLINYNLDNHQIKIEVDNLVYDFGLLETGISFIKMFYLDYYKNEKFLNVKTGEIINTVFG
ncbi:hypothetical protein [Halalkalibacter oceani]|uniref:hypothetical protein n=1 Tax=Halalkalibacter oceani TaxID=1653776 RepID=UPI003394D416